MATESRLAPVPGPVPHSYSGTSEIHLPEAFTSTATHFTPIILTNEVDSEETSQHLGPASEGLNIPEYTLICCHIHFLTKIYFYNSYKANVFLNMKGTVSRFR